MKCGIPNNYSILVNLLRVEFRIFPDLIKNYSIYNLDLCQFINDLLQMQEIKEKKNQFPKTQIPFNKELKRGKCEECSTEDYLGIANIFILLRDTLS